MDGTATGIGLIKPTAVRTRCQGDHDLFTSISLWSPLERYICDLRIALSRLTSPAVGKGGATIDDGWVTRTEEPMDSYTITIAPNDDSGAATRLVVDTSGDQVRITDVHLHAPRGLSSGHIPTVDFDLLLQAVTGTVTTRNGQSAPAAAALSAPDGTPALAAPTATEPAAPATPKGRTRKTEPRATTPPRRPARTRTAAAASPDETAAPQRSTGAAAASTRRAVRQTPATASRKNATAKTPTPANKQTVTRTTAAAKRQAPTKRTRAATTAAPAASGRVYRRTPDDLATVFEQVGTVAGIAAHYQVPRYTAQGWVNRLRSTT